MNTPESSEAIQPIEAWAQLSDKWEASGNYLGACDAALLGLEQHPEARELQYRAVLNLSRIGASKRARQLWLHQSAALTRACSEARPQRPWPVRSRPSMPTWA